MPAWYMAIIMESQDVRWRAKRNADISDSGPDDRKLIIEFEGDLEKMPWISNLSGQKATVDLDTLAASVPSLFDKAWLRGQGPQEVGIAVLGNHHMIEINLKKL
ncbi:MAG: hypothetical protein A4E63_00372 [Syntrophorhabdus sp. PtaU1.Bin050]|nr:MAG: hypothetical protein A4E63_00372 [Syntrophorhabdus sp. PtaU1.Bin050]